MALIRSCCAILAVLALTWASPSLAGEGAGAKGLGDKNPVRATLVASVDAAAPDADFHVGVLLEMAPKWHVYWTSPGNTGTATRVKFTFDKQRLSLEAPRYPVPEVFDPDDLEFLSFGYSHSVLIPAAALVVEAPPSGKTTIGARVSWLACKKTCIPGKVDISLELPVADKARPSAAAPTFKDVVGKLPEEADAGRAWIESLAYTEGGYTARIRVAGLKQVSSFIPSMPEGSICTIAGHKVVAEQGKDPLVELRFTGDNCLPGLGGLVLGTAKDGPEGSAPRAYQIQASPREEDDEDEEAAAATPAAPAATVKSAGAPAAGKTAELPPAQRESLWLMLIFAFLGGLLLNVMPCVIPVVVPKILSVVRTAQKAEGAEQRAVLWGNGLAYTAGVVATMLSLAVTVVVLKMVGREVGWGFQFQNPWFLLFMISLLLVLGLGMLHVYPLKSSEHQDQLKTLKKKRRKKPRWESFLTGLLVTFLGTPCTAPMLGPALGYAFTASTFEILLLMFTVGLGLSAPFLLLGAWTGWTKILPMRVSERYDKIMRGMAFLLFGTGVWLLGVLASAYGTEAAINATWFLLALGLASWIFGLVATEKDPWSKRLKRLAPMVAAVAVFGWWILEFPEAGAASAAASKGGGKAHLVDWVPFTEKKVSDLQASGKTVFIDFTADWCMNCKANERMVIETKPTVALMDKLKVVPVKADNTRHDPVIQKWLKRYGRAGVPMYIVMPACKGIGDAELLPEILTSDILHEALKRAGASKACKG